MKTALLIAITIILLCAIGYYVLFPKNKIITIFTGEKSGIVFSKERISYRPAPDHFATDGMNHLAPYVSKLVVPSRKFKSLGVFTPDGKRGLGLVARNSQIKVDINIDWRKEPEKEKAIREYFEKMNIQAVEDYLGGNGNIPDAVRLLAYPIQGNETEITNMIKDMLQRFYNISHTEALDIRYEE